MDVVRDRGHHRRRDCDVARDTAGFAGVVNTVAGCQFIQSLQHLVVQNDDTVESILLRFVRPLPHFHEAVDYIFFRFPRSSLFRMSLDTLLYSVRLSTPFDSR